MKKSSTLSIGQNKQSELCRMVQVEDIIVDAAVYEYQKKGSVVVTRVEGEAATSKIADTYYDDLSKKLKDIQYDLVQKLIKMVKFNFTLHIKIDDNCEINTDQVKLVFKIPCNKNALNSSVYETFRLPFSILIPFSEYIDYLHIRVRKYEINIIEAEVNLSMEELNDLIDMPLSGPTAKTQWFDFMSKAVMEVKKGYNIDVTVPVYDGEVLWSVPQKRRLQHVEEVYA